LMISNSFPIPHATAAHALLPFGQRIGGNSFQFKEPEFPNVWTFSYIAHF
jgi:hypothetical protein